MDIFNKMLDANSARSLFVYLFILLILFSFIATFFVKNSLKLVTLGKIIGGFSVFVFSIISDNTAVKIISIFIGGLLIASEDFMKNLAIIFRSNSVDMAKNLGFKDSPATPVESEQKDESKIREDVEFSKIESNENTNTTKVASDIVHPSFSERMRQNKKVESMVFEYLNDRFGSRLQKDVKIENKYGVFIADGVLYSRYEPEKISQIIEIKYAKEISNKMMSLEFFVRRTLEKMRYIFIKERLLLIIVADIIDQDSIKKFLNHNRYRNVSFWFFKLQDDKINKLFCSHLISEN